ncbi:MAG: MarR family winged helix-turn-helix transcriptional regulator [Rhizobiaceae bacterium]
MVVKTKNAKTAGNSTPVLQTKIPSLGEIGLSRFEPYLMNRIMGRWNANLQERMSTRGLTVVKMRTLAVLSVIPELTVSQLSVYSVIEQSTLSRSLDAMVEQGFINREPGKNDGRVREIVITTKGREAFEAFWPDMYENYNNLFLGVEEAERDAFLKTLNKLLENIRKNEL